MSSSYDCHPSHTTDEQRGTYELNLKKEGFLFDDSRDGTGVYFAR